jgi:hypothetical protein
MLLLKFCGALIQQIGYKKGVWVSVHVLLSFCAKGYKKVNLTGEIRNHSALVGNPLINHFITAPAFQ